jgi:hypothetical protein
MVDQCLDQNALEIAYECTRSCAKSSRRGHWINRTGPSGKAPLGCGICVPCLFRRASLHARGFDKEVYGIPVEDITDLKGDAKSDLLALIAFLRRNDSDREIAAGLLGNGPLALNQLSQYVDLVKRMRAEVLVWIRTKGSAYLKNEVRAC